MLTSEQRKSVKLIARGLKCRWAETEIIQRLLPLGISEENAVKVLEYVQDGIRAGVNAALTNGLSAKQYRRGESELYDYAFHKGYTAFKNQMRWTWFRRFVVVSLVVIVMIWLLLYLR